MCLGRPSFASDVGLGLPSHQAKTVTVCAGTPTGQHASPAQLRLGVLQLAGKRWAAVGPRVWSPGWKPRPHQEACVAQHRDGTSATAEPCVCTERHCIAVFVVYPEDTTHLFHIYLFL